MRNPTVSERLSLVSKGLFLFNACELEIIISEIDNNPEGILMDGNIVDSATERC